MGFFSRLLKIKIGFTVGIIYSILPIAWIYGSSFTHTPSIMALVTIMVFFACFIACQYHEGRMFFKGCVTTSMFTLLPFGVLIFALPQASNSTLGLILLGFGLVFSIYQGIYTAVDSEERTIFGRLLDDGLSTGIPGLISRIIFPRNFQHISSGNRNTAKVKSSVSVNTEKLVNNDDKNNPSTDFSGDILVGSGTKYHKRRKHKKQTSNHPSINNNNNENNSGSNNIPNPAGLRYKTLDGHMVRSKAEMLIANWLTQHNILYFYEKSVPNTPYFCDFYLPNQNIFVEYWGKLDDPEYQTRMKQKTEAYHTQGLRLINITDTDIQKDLDAVLQEKITKNNNDVVVPNNTAEKTSETKLDDKEIEHKKENNNNNYWE